LPILIFQYKSATQQKLDTCALSRAHNNSLSTKFISKMHQPCLKKNKNLPVC
jgi:hypothetical protein